MFQRAPADTLVATVRACFLQNCPSKNVEYHLIGSDMTDFKVNRSTGQVMTSGMVSKPLDSRYNFMVVAMSSGSDVYVEAQVFVSLYNTYTPQFSENLYEEYLQKDTPWGRWVMAILATDEDQKDYNKEIRYFLKESQYSDLFVLDRISGNLTLMKSLPRNVNKMTLAVTAKNSGSPL